MQNIKSYRALFILIALLLFAAEKISAQKERNFWYFGNGCGLDFNSGQPVALTDGVLNTSEGCATISTRKGELLFYTDGKTVWNKSHNVMPNGSGLKGNSSSTQSAVVAHLPGNYMLYYIFTVDDVGGPDGMQYSIVDMSLDNGKGDIITKNVLINSSTCEKIAVVSHQNKRDYWIIMHENGNSRFNAYLLTSMGLSTNPVVSSIGPIIQQSNISQTLGYLKSSPNGKNLICANFTRNADLYDFNDVTGEINNQVVLELNVGAAVYGAEFSADSKVAYIGDYNRNTIYQFNVAAGSETLIQQSKYEVHKLNNGVFGALQLATDNKIYISQDYHGYLNSIENPNQLGVACSYKRNSIFLEGRRGTLGLPTFVSTLTPPIASKYLCYGDSTEFEVIGNLIDSIHWDFGEVGSRANNHSRLINPKHKFSEAKNYTVTAIIYYDSYSDTLQHEIDIVETQAIFLGNDTTLCNGDSLIIPIENYKGTYRWQDSSTNSKFIVKNSGTYFLEVTNGQCYSHDTITISLDSIPIINLPEYIDLCDAVSTELSINSVNAQFLWQDGSTSSTHSITEPGVYWVRATNNCGESIDSVRVSGADCGCIINIPNSMTPNGDGLNEVFKSVHYQCDFLKYELIVFNRWGEVIFKTSDPTRTWDGTIKGSLVPSGIYYFLLDATTKHREKIFEEGAINVLR